MRLRLAAGGGVYITGSQGQLAEFGVCAAPATSNLAAWAWRVGETCARRWCNLDRGNRGRDMDVVLIVARRRWALIEKLWQARLGVAGSGVSTRCHTIPIHWAP